MLVVPLSLHESLAYAVPGFTTAAGSVGAAAGAVVVPLLAKAAAVGAAAALAGSAGVLADRQIRDSPARPVDAAIAHGNPPMPAPVVERVSPTRSLVSAGTPMLDPRSGATGQEDSQSGEHDDETAMSDREDGERDDELRKSDHGSSEHDNELQKSDQQSAERDGGHGDRAEHEVLSETAHTDEATDSPDVSIELDVGAESTVPQDGADVHEPDSGGDSHSDLD